METIHMVGLAVALVMLYFCAALMSSNRSRGLGFSIWQFFHSHAEGLDAYSRARKAARKANQEALAQYEQNRQKKQKEAALRKAAVRAAQEQFERTIMQ